MQALTAAALRLAGHRMQIAVAGHAARERAALQRLAPIAVRAALAVLAHVARRTRALLDEQSRLQLAPMQLTVLVQVDIVELGLLRVGFRRFQLELREDSARVDRVRGTYANARQIGEQALKIQSGQCRHPARELIQLECEYLFFFTNRTIFKSFSFTKCTHKRINRYTIEKILHDKKFI